MSRGLGSSGESHITSDTDLAAGTAPIPRLPSERNRNRHRQGYWIAAGTAVGLVGLAGGGLALVAGQSPQPARVVAADCGLVRCSATLPPTAVTSPAAAGTPSSGRQHRPATAHVMPPVAVQHVARVHSSSPATPAQRPATQPPTPAPAHSPSGPAVTVTFTVDRTQNRWGDRRYSGEFAAHLTVVNHTGAAITGWTLQTGLASAEVRWVSTSANGFPGYPGWHLASGGMVIDGLVPSEALAAHGATVFYISGISGWGTVSLTSCSFNGRSC